jgi:PAS domain S-box-containing protein
VDLTLYKPATLQRRISRRMVLAQARRLPDYIAHLRQHPEELDALYQDLLINVTRFFRDPETFDLLKNDIFPRLLKNRSVDDPIRVWVVGCSTGQEVYSIAMTFLEYAATVATQVPLRIFATDLNEMALEKARVGLYSKTQLDDVSPQRRRRFFTEEDGGLRICKSLRELCVFARHDILADPPFSRMDLLSCRNVMIYLEPVLQKKLIPVFHYALNPNGFLMLGNSETPAGTAELFIPESKKVFLKKGGMPGGERRNKNMGGAREKKPPYDKKRGISERAAAETEVQREADRISLAKYGPAGVLVNESMEVLQFRGQTSPYLEQPAGRASFNLLKMLREGLLLPVRTAIERARKKNSPVRAEDIVFRFEGQDRTVSIEVTPLKSGKERCYLVLFEPSSRMGRNGQPSVPAPVLSAPKGTQAREILRLRRELQAARDYLQTVSEQHDDVNEELQASSEEAESSNEELQSINEELETTKEELESTNEELTTVNEEMNNRNLELHRIISDLSNILTSGQLCIVVLGNDLSIRRFTPLAEKILNILPTDVGRPITHIKPNFDLPELEGKLLEAIHSVTPSTEEVQDRHGRWFSLRIFPYKTVDNRIDGAVLVLVDIDAVKRSEDQVRRARDYAESTFEAVREPLVVLDPQLRIQRINRSFYKLFRVSPAEVLGRSLTEIGSGQWDIPKLLNLLRDIVPRSSFFDDLEIEGEFDRLGHRVMLLSARPIAGEGENPQSILLAFEDCTERKQLDALKISESHFRTLAEALPQLVWTCPPDGKCDYFNGRWTEYTGVPFEKLLGDQWRETMSPLDRKRTCDYWLQALKGTVPYDLEYRLRRADGVFHWFKTRANPVLDSNGKILKWFGTCTDIEDQKQGQQVIEQSEKWLRLIMESVKDFAIFTTDPTGAVVDWNPGAEHVFGYSAAEILGMDASILFTPEDRANGVPEQELQTASNDGCAMDERWHLRKGGERLFVSGAMRAIRGEDGTLHGFTKVARDMTERKRWEQELQAAHDDLERRVSERTARLGETVEELEAFSYSISHDLRAPLRAMLGFANLALSDATLTPRTKDSLDRIIKAANRLDRLIMDVLAYSKASRADISVIPIDLNGLVLDVVNQYPGLQAPEITINIESPLMPAMGHEAILTQCVANFLTNAIKFVAPGTNPHIRIWTELVDGQVRLSVQDNGIGIDPHCLPRIFGIFERVHASHEYEGTGIGLAIVRRSAERMGGSVGVESQPGEGSIFWIQLKPVSPA